MKSLQQKLQESLEAVNEGIKPADDKLFWKWIEDMGSAENIGYPDGIFSKAEKLGTTPKQFELFGDIFYHYANEIDDIYSEYEDDLDLGFSDDTCQYMSWGAVWQGEKVVKRFLQKHDNPAQIFNFDWEDGEAMGGVMSNYEDYEESLTKKPKGYK